MSTYTQQLKSIIMAVLLFTASASVAYAADGLIDVDFHGNAPLFAEANILPGDGVTRQVTVENLSEESQDVYLQLLDAYEEKGFGDVLELTVRDGSTTYIDKALLSSLLGGTQSSLTTGLSSGASVTYDVTISFVASAGNEYQEGEVGFDFCIGFSGGAFGCDGAGGETPTEPGSRDASGVVGGPCTNCDEEDDNNEDEPNDDGNNGSGGSLENLIITNESAENVDDGGGAADLTWDTNKPATSKVVCGPLVSGPYAFTLSPEDNFGYPWGSTETDTEVTEHIVSLVGLDPGTYLCRAASREAGDDDWTVSDEFAFTIAQSSTTGTPASFIGTGNTPVAFAAEDETDASEREEKATSDENKPNNQVAGAFASLGDSAVDGTCATQWLAWFVVLIGFLVAILWSREMMTHLNPEKPVKRLYVLGVAGLVILVIAFTQSALSWIVPIGTGTVAILVATIIDTIRTKPETLPVERLKQIVRTLLAVSLLVLILAFAFEWLCSVLPLIIIIIVLIIRYALLRNVQQSNIALLSV